MDMGMDNAGPGIGEVPTNSPMGLGPHCVGAALHY